MKQARTLNDRELKNLLTLVARRRYALRDRNMLLLTHWAGMRIGEVAALLVGDVVGLNGEIVLQINLKPHQTKGDQSRSVVLSTRVRSELRQYLLSRFAVGSLKEIASDKLGKPLFATQMRAGFTANTACYHFFMLYREAGFTGASSHSGRRSFLTKLSAKSVPLKTMMELAGHRQAQTTMRYVSVTPDMKRAAVELLS